MELSLGTFFLSLLPLVISSTPLTEHENLRISAAALLVFYGWSVVLRIRRDARLPAEERSRMLRPAMYLFNVLTTSLLLALVLVIAGALPSFAMSVYLSGLVVLLLAASTQFYTLLRSGFASRAAR